MRFGQRLKEAGESAFAAFVRNRDDRQLERTIGSRPGLWAIFKGMERGFVPSKAQGFEGEVQYVLTSEGRPDRGWVVRIAGYQAKTRPGTSLDPAVTLTFSVPTFARIISNVANPAGEMMAGRFTVSGDLEVAIRLGEMFGADPAF